MSRARRRAAWIGGIGLAVAAACSPGLTTAASAAAAERPDLIATEVNGSVRLLPGDSSQTTSLGLDGVHKSSTAVAPNGDLWVAGGDRVRRVSADGGGVEVYRGYGNAYGVAVGWDGTVYVSDLRGTVYIQPEDGPPQPFKEFTTPSQLSLDGDGNLLVPDFSSGTVTRVTPGGDGTVVARGLRYPQDAAEAPDGTIVATEQNSGRVKRFTEVDTVTTLTTVLGGADGVTVGEDGTIYVASYDDDAIVSVPASGGSATRIATLEGPIGLTLAEPPGPALSPQTITITSTAPDDATVDDTYTPTATGGASGNPVTFSIADSAAEVCSIDTGTDEVTFDGPGTCTIAADQAGDEEYADAEQVTQAVVVNVPELFITGQVSSEVPENGAGWYRTPATVTYTCGGGTAPLVCPEPVTRQNTRPGFAVARKVTDADGQETKVRTPLQVDTTAPRIEITRTGTAPYARDAEPISCTGVDVGSGIDGDCTVTYGRIVQGPQGPQRGGTRRWLATVTDVAGNTTTVSRAFRVEGRAPRRATPTGTR